MSNKRRGHKKKPTTRRQRINGRQGEELDEALADSSPVNGTNNGSSRGGKKSRGGDSGRLLTKPKEVVADARLIERAVRGRWGVRRRGMIRRRLEEIVAKTEVEVHFGTKEGPVGVNSPDSADKNAVAAARVLVAMDSMDQADDHFEVKNKTPATPGVGIYVNGGNNPQSGSSQIVQLAIALGATELVIDGSAVPVTESTGKPPEARVVQSGAGKPVGEDPALAKAKELLGLR